MSGLQEDLRVLRLSRWRTIGMRRTPAKVWTGPEFAAAGLPPISSDHRIDYSSNLHDYLLSTINLHLKPSFNGIQPFNAVIFPYNPAAASCHDSKSKLNFAIHQSMSDTCLPLNWHVPRCFQCQKRLSGAWPANGLPQALPQPMLPSFPPQ